MHLLERFPQENRVRIPNPRRDLQPKIARQRPNGNEFLPYIDATSERDSTGCLTDWKNNDKPLSRRPCGIAIARPTIDFVIPGQPAFLMWRSSSSGGNISRRSRISETSISEKQRIEFARQSEATVGQIDAVQFPPHSGIRLFQDTCLSCPHLGLCLYKSQLPVVEKPVETASIMLGTDSLAVTTSK